MLEAIVMFAAAAAEEHKDHTAFYVAGGLLAAWAVVVSFVGIRGHENWPSSDGVATAIMGISTVLVVAACAAAVISG